MKYWAKGTGFQFRNSDDCFGESFDVADASLNLAVITVKARYPESGHLFNTEAHEMVYVISGDGTILTKAGDSMALSAGDAIHFSPDERVAWNGDMVLLTACSPAFEEDKHILEEGL